VHVLKYQHANSTQTLEEGLSEYYASREGLVRGRGLSPAASEFFRCHDAAHVVFGCNTTLVNELIVKVWSFFGTTGGLGLLRAYRLPESQEIYEHLKWSDIAVVSVRSVVLFPLVLWHCVRMRKRWPWSEFDEYLVVPLAEIRRKFGITLVSG
jgi:hypothetical protein